jgi:hypothetical protein
VRREVARSSDNYETGRQSGFARRSPRPPGEGSAGTWSRGPFTGCDREGARKHADIRRVASRCGVTSIGKSTEPVPPSAGAGVRDRAMLHSYVKLDRWRIFSLPPSRPRDRRASNAPGRTRVSRAQALSLSQRTDGGNSSSCRHSGKALAGYRKSVGGEAFPNALDSCSVHREVPDAES